MTADEIKSKLNEICIGIKGLDDSEFKELVNTGVFDKFLLAIYDPKDPNDYNNVQERLLKNKERLSFLARLRLAINENYSFKGTVNGESVYVSPLHSQWLDNGIIFTQGKDRWAGLIGFYDNEGDLYFAKSKRNFRAGDKIDLRKDFFFDFFYQKVQGMPEINSEDKKEILEKMDKIEKENKPSKKEILISKFAKWLDDKTDRIWYQTVKAFFESLNKN